MKRKSLRLPNFDYSTAGWYYVTICTYNKKNWFGKIVKGKMRLNIIGKYVQRCWEDIPNHISKVDLDCFVNMPNHLHGIIILNNQSRGVQLNAPTKRSNIFGQMSPKSNSLSTIIRTFKAAVKTWCNNNKYSDFRWQRNYYEHIIRNYKDLENIRKYILYHPLKWEIDEENPYNIK
jgi:putative transposase